MLILAAAFGTIGTVVQIALAVAAIGLSIASQYLLKPKQGTQSPTSLNNEPVTTANRGAFIPYLLGRRRLGPVVGWVGGRQAFSAGKAPNGKGSRGRKTKGFAPGLVYYENGIHFLCIGPAKKLWRIWEGGKQVWPNPGHGPITPLDTPSGSTVSFQGIAGPESFRIYWGTDSQPIDSLASTPTPVGLGVPTRFPLVCYVVWANKRLGSAARWPLLEYDVECETQDAITTVVNTPKQIDYTYYPNPVSGFTGPNPAHVLSQILFGPFPYGCNLDQAWFDPVCLEAVGKLAKVEGLPVCVYGPDGTLALDLITSIMTDLGIALPWDIAVVSSVNSVNVLGSFRWTPVRSPSDNLPGITYLQPYAVSDDTIVDAPEVENILLAKPVDKLVFSYADKDHNFKTVTVVIDDDGQARQEDVQNYSNSDMRTIIFFDEAKRVADRRSQEGLARVSKYSMTLNRGNRILRPGMPITVPAGITSDLLRISEMELSPLSTQIKVTAVTDFYAAAIMPAATPNPMQPPTDSNGNPVGGGVSYPVFKDEDFGIVEVPAHILQGGPQTVVVPRIRHDVSMTGAEVLLSADDVTYVDEGAELGIQTGGALSSFLADTDPFLMDQGPTFDAEGPDITTATLDLSGDLVSWRSGKQMVAINDELFFLKKVTALGGSIYRLDGLIRARYDTDRHAHAPGDRVFIFQPDDILDVTDPGLLSPGAVVWAKTEPQGMGGSVDLSTVAGVMKTLIGKGVVPMPVGALRDTSNTFNTFRTGQDTTLAWGYRSAAIPGTGAGMQGAGAAVGSSPIAGTFELKFYDLAMTLKATRTSPTNSFTYTNAMLIADFGAEQSYIVEVRNINGGWRSIARTIEIDFLT